MKRIGILLCLILASLLIACSSSKEEQSAGEALTESAYLAEATNTKDVVREGTIPLFYTNVSSTSLYEIENNYDFSNMNEEEVLEKVLSDLKEISNIQFNDRKLEELTLQSIIPDGILKSTRLRTDTEKTRSITTKKSYHIMEFYMTDLYYDMSLNQRIVLRAGLSRTIFSTGVADEIEFYAPDVSKATGEMVLINTSSSEDKLIINQYSQDFYQEEVHVNLYFGNAAGDKLVKESRVLMLNMTETLPMAIMKALIAGPEDTNLTSVIPQGTMVKDVFIKDGVCYVDLSAEFQKNHLGGEREENLTIYSIVNSLQNVSGIRYVQFLIGGKKDEYYKSYVKIDGFLTANLSLVE